MIGKIKYDESGKTVLSPLSPYQPPQEVKALISQAALDVQHGDDILNRPFREFNEMTVIQRANLDQKDWLGWSPEPSDDDDESFMFTGTSTITRAKVISTAAHLTRRIIYPGIFAQNPDQEEDREASYVARGLMEYYSRISNYEETFLFAVISALVNPVSYFEADYCEAYQTIIEGTNDHFVVKEVVDDVMSGFQDHLLAVNEVLIDNPYCFNIQKQRVLNKRRRISYSQAKAIHGKHPNWVHVRVGVKSIGNPGNGLFYDVADDLEDGLVEEIVRKERGCDSEVVYVNGVYLGNPNTAYNPFKHRTNKNKPEYNIAKFGAEPIDAKRFWAYKSLAAKISNDKELVDRMRQNAVDASTMNTWPSVFTMGAGALDKSVFVPARVTDLPKDAKVSPATGYANPSFAYDAAREAEEQINKTSIDPQFGGISDGPQKTRGESIILQENAINNLGVMTTMLRSMVCDIGRIKLHDYLRFATTAEVGEIVNGVPTLTYKTLNLNKVRDGKSTTDVIKFTDKYLDKKVSKEEYKKLHVELLEEHGEDSMLYEINPDGFIRLDFLLICEAEEFRPRSDALEKAVKMDIYDKAIANPLIANNPDLMAAVTRDFLFEPSVKGEASKYLPDSTKKVLNNLLTPEESTGQNGAVPGKSMLKSKVMNDTPNY